MIKRPDMNQTVPLPLYRRVSETILDRITCGELGPGAMLPSEPDLAAQLGVSPGTARKALMALESRGILRREQGRGTFVATTTPESALFHFFRLRRADGGEVTPVLESEEAVRRDATGEERDAFGRDCDAVFEVSRVRSIDGRRIVHEVINVPTGLFPGLIDRRPLPNAIYALYQRSYNIRISEACERLRAVLADAEDAERLDVEAGAALIDVLRRATDLAGRTVELRRSRYVTDDLHYALTLR